MLRYQPYKVSEKLNAREYVSLFQFSSSPPLRSISITIGTYSPYRTSLRLFASICSYVVTVKENSRWKWIILALEEKKKKKNVIRFLKGKNIVSFVFTNENRIYSYAHRIHLSVAKHLANDIGTVLNTLFDWILSSYISHVLWKIHILRKHSSWSYGLKRTKRKGEKEFVVKIL